MSRTFVMRIMIPSLGTFTDFLLAASEYARSVLICRAGTTPPRLAAPPAAPPLLPPPGEAAAWSPRTVLPCESGLSLGVPFVSLRRLDAFEGDRKPGWGSKRTPVVEADSMAAQAAVHQRKVRFRRRPAPT
mmetsp:Transcript_10219/g.32231  ORF Transcript_10219/g.32231 Transcript_10219/m.32231 type:complete len:131 (-) Transcript_10219:43-435(-)